MKVIIAGGGGFLGKYLVNELAKQKHQVTVFDLHIAKEALAKLECSFVECDLFKQTDLSLGQKFDVAIFLAQSPFYRKLPEMAPHVVGVNVEGLTSFLEAMRLSGVKHFLYASSGSIYKSSFSLLNENSPIEPTNLYELTKSFGENIVNYYSNFFNTTIMRFFTIYGPGQSGMMIPKLITNIKSREAIFLEKTSMERQNITGVRISPIFVLDAAKIVSKLLKENIGGIFNIAGSEVLSIRDVANTIGEQLKEPPIFSVSENDRIGDLIADNAKMLSFYRDQLTNFSSGIEKTIGCLTNVKVK